MKKFKDFGIKNYVSAAEMVKKAKLGKYAVGQFNINNLEWTRAALEAAQETNSPIILGVSEGAAKYFGGYNTVVGIVTNLMIDLNITVPVAIHLDHGSSIESAKKAVDAGFSSIMIDGSHFSIDENIRITKEVVAMCKPKGISVEGEVGLVAGEEDGVHGGSAATYADENECIRMAKEGGIDFLAATLGSVHGHYNGAPKLGFEQMVTISSKADIPLVLHGGSGIPDADIVKAIKSGQSKINVNTECQDAFAHALNKYFANKMDQADKGYDPRKIIGFGIKETKRVIIEKIKLFGSDNKA